MGEEELKNQEEQTSESEVKGEIEGQAIKILRKKYEDTIKRLKELEEENKSLKEVTRVANLDELANKVDKLDFENTILKKYPDLVGEVEEIWQFRKAGESVDETVAKYIGKKTLEGQQKATPQGFSLGSQNISPNLEEDLSSLPLSELEKRAREEFKKIYGRE